MYPKQKASTQRDICAPMFTEELFTIVKVGNKTSVPQRTNGYTKYGVDAQWKISQPQERIKVW